MCAWTLLTEANCQPDTGEKIKNYCILLYSCKKLYSGIIISAHGYKVLLDNIIKCMVKLSYLNYLESHQPVSAHFSSVVK